MKLIIAGGREFTDYNGMVKALDKLLIDTKEVTIVSGGARGADRLGERYAKERGYPVIMKLADWDKLGKRAGYVRNEEMAKIATHLVAFHDGVSRGTAHMISLGRKYNLITRIGKY